MYAYSNANVLYWPSGGEVVFTVTFTPKSFNNTTTCGPSR
jgi:hypothetical protein